MHTTDKDYNKYAGTRDLYPCHNNDKVCHATYTMDDWHCHECQHQGNTEADKKFFEMEDKVKTNV